VSPTKKYFHRTQCGGTISAERKSRCSHRLLSWSKLDPGNYRLVLMAADPLEKSASRSVDFDLE